MSTWKNKDKIIGLLSSSFDRRQQAESANKREKQKLQSEQRSLDLYKSETLKTLSASETKLISKTQSLLKQNRTSLIRDSPFGDKTSSLPVIRVRNTSASTDVDLARDIENRYLYKANSLTELSHDNSIASTDVPTDLLPPLGRKQLKLPAIIQAKAQLSKEEQDSRGKRSTRDMNTGFVNPSVKNDNSDTQSSKRAQRQTWRSYRNLGETTGKSSDLETPRLSSRRRSLSLNDIPLAERINAFLESVELAKNSEGSSDE